MELRTIFDSALHFSFNSIELQSKIENSLKNSSGSQIWSQVATSLYRFIAMFETLLIF